MSALLIGNRRQEMLTLLPASPSAHQPAQSNRRRILSLAVLAIVALGGCEGAGDILPGRSRGQPAQP